jgi:hypothetical protein
MRYVVLCLFIVVSLITLLSFNDEQVFKHRKLYQNFSGGRRFKLMSSGLSSTSFSSTCSLAADRRGANQKVIGYSIFGNLSQPDIFLQYLKPFIETLKTIPDRYPGNF